MENHVPLLQLTISSIAVPMIPLGKQMPNVVRALHSDDPVIVENSLYETNVLETYVWKPKRGSILQRYMKPAMLDSMSEGGLLVLWLATTAII